MRGRWRSAYGTDAQLSGERAKGSVLVSGAAGAIGRATVAAFLEAGYAVVGIDRVPEEGRGATCPMHVVDLLDGNGLEGAIADAVERAPLSHVIGIAGGALPEEPIAAEEPWEVDEALFRRSLEANLDTQFRLVRATVPALMGSAAADRSVILTSSFNAISAQGMPAYSAAKAALHGLMRAMVRPLGAKGVRINVVAPGTIRTPRTERIWATRQGHFESLEASTALGRLGTPDDVAATYLGLSAMRHVTGHVLVVDGGQSLGRS